MNDYQQPFQGYGQLLCDHVAEGMPLHGSLCLLRDAGCSEYSEVTIVTQSNGPNFKLFWKLARQSKMSYFGNQLRSASASCYHGAFWGRLLPSCCNHVADVLQAQWNVAPLSPLLVWCVSVSSTISARQSLLWMHSLGVALQSHFKMLLSVHCGNDCLSCWDLQSFISRQWWCTPSHVSSHAVQWDQKYFDHKSNCQRVIMDFMLSYILQELNIARAVFGRPP